MHMAQMGRQWTVEDLATLPDDGNRYEVIDGELLVTPAPRFAHQRAVGKLHLLLAPYVAEQRLGEIIMAPADVTFGPDRGVQPDLFVVPFVEGRVPESYGEVGRLLLSVEVLLRSTARADRVKKRQLYREEQVPEYWVVDLDARVFERSTPRDERIEVISDRLEWQPEGATAPFVLEVERYFEGL